MMTPEYPHARVKAVTLVVVLILAFAVGNSFSQSSYSGPVNCEMGLVLQDFVINAALESQEGILIAIVRSGTEETSAKLRRRRTENVRQFFKNRGNRLDPSRVLVAEGENVAGYGRIEYYLGGKLIEQVYFSKNRYICHSCCGPDEEYHPKSRKVLRRGRKK